MKEPISRYFLVGTLQWMSYPQLEPVQALHKIALDPFFSAVELAAGLGEQSQKIRSILAQSHLTSCIGVQPRLLERGLNPNAIEESQRQQAETVLLEAVDEAAALGAGGIAFLAGKWQEETKSLAYSQLLKTTRTICQYASQKKLKVELEVFDYDVDKKSLIGPAPLAARFASDLRSSCGNFGLIVDLSHIPLTHETSRFVIRTLRPYITHLHFGNAVLTPGKPGYGDKHPRFGFPHSVNDVHVLKEYLQILREEGFFLPQDPCILSMEVTPQPGEEADLVLAGTKRVLQRAWSLLPDD